MTETYQLITRRTAVGRASIISFFIVSPDPPRRSFQFRYQATRIHLSFCLLLHLRNISNTSTRISCPHGKPIYLHMTSSRECTLAKDACMHLVYNPWFSQHTAISQLETKLYPRAAPESWHSPHLPYPTSIFECIGRNLLSPWLLLAIVQKRIRHLPINTSLTTVDQKTSLKCFERYRNTFRSN